MKRGEFVALVAMLFSTIAFSVDSILAAFPQIGADLGATGQVHLLISFFMAGLALGTLFAGPVSDAMGRKPTMFIGAFLYIGSGLVAWMSSDFTIILAARFIQGLAAAGPRVVALAIVRDLYAGPQMAQIVSFAMVLFTIVPTLAPAMGAGLEALFGWRSILLAMVLFSTISTVWMWLRLPETLPPESRRRLRLGELMSAGKEVARHPVVSLAILAQCVAIGMIFCLIVQVQPIYDQTFGLAESFPYWFGGIALFSAASTSLANASLVVRFGMRRLVTWGMAGHVICAFSAYLVIRLLPDFSFVAFVLWQFMVIWLAGLSVGNLNAIALEPMGHIAGFTASITGAVSTFAAAALATYSGRIFDGTPLPLTLMSGLVALLGLIVMWRMRKVEARMAELGPVFTTSRKSDR